MFTMVGGLRSLKGAERTLNTEPREEIKMTEENVNSAEVTPEEAIEQGIPAEQEELDLGGIDDLLDISDVPLPPEEVMETVDDEFKQKAAFKFCFIGAGQGGGRIAHQFWSYGYRRVCAVNTADADLNPLPLPQANKLKLLGAKEGAGGDPIVGESVAKKNREEVFNLMRNSFGNDFDRIFVCATAGGGTGAGSCEEIVRIAHELVEKLELGDEGYSKVGVIIALPKEADGRDSARSAYTTVKKLATLAPDLISPIIIVDNQRIEKLYPKTPAGQFWTKANHAVGSIFHLLNLVAARESAYTSFDQSDYESILRSGILAYGAMPVTNWSDRDAISTAIRDNLTKNVLIGGMDLSTGNIAGCVVVGPKTILDNELPQEYLDNSFSMLGRMIRPGSPTRHGVYAGGNGKHLVAYTLIGGLNEPTARLDELKKLGGLIDHDGA